MAKKKKVETDDWGIEGLDFSEESNSSNNDSADGLFFDVENTKKQKTKKLTTGRIVWCVFFGIFTTAFMVLLTYGVWRRYVTYPPQEEVNHQDTGQYCLEKWVEQIKTLDSVGEDSYLHREIEYANGDEDKIAFYKKMVSTVKYTPNDSIAKNIYGNQMISMEDDSVVHINSYIGLDEEVSFSYVDYASLKFDSDTSKEKLKQLLADYDEGGLTLSDVDYQNKLVDVFIDYMNWLPVDEIPVKVIQRKPNLTNNSNYQGRDKEGSPIGGDCPYVVTEREDVFLDRLLFSSNEFVDCLDRFSLQCARLNNEGTLEVTDEYRDWNKMEEKVGRRPSQYHYKQCISKLWCGSYYLSQEYSGGLLPELGDGTITNPAGYNTDIVTGMYISQYDDLGNITEWKRYPIRVSLVEYGVSQDAIDYFESLDDRNRGINIASELQYCYAKFEITNLSSETITISDNMSVCDRNGNMQARTGIIYGIHDSEVLEPDESTIIETWQSSTDLYKKYLVWGADFARREDPVYFRVLAGDLENEDQYKGVTVNDTRSGDSQFSQKQEVITNEEPPATEPRHD